MGAESREAPAGGFFQRLEMLNTSCDGPGGAEWAPLQAMHHGKCVSQKLIHELEVSRHAWVPKAKTHVVGHLACGLFQTHLGGCETT